jgi:iron only hydrogenase large subunit-like protein
MIRTFRRTVAIPAPALYAQFDETHSVDRILSGLLKLGFDEVFEVAEAIDLIARATNDLLMDSGGGTGALALPLISSACPAVVRIVQLRFPRLVPHLVPLIPPMEAAARIVKETMYRGEEGLGVFFITPCAGKVSVTHAPLGYEKSAIDGVIGFKDIYRPLRSAMDDFTDEEFAGSSAVDAERSEGRTAGDTIEKRGEMKIEGIANVIDMLAALDRGELDGLRYIEALACPNGCVGGPLAVEDPDVARSRLRRREEIDIPRTRRTRSYRQLSPLFWSESLLPPPPAQL